MTHFNKYINSVAFKLSKDTLFTFFLVLFSLGNIYAQNATITITTADNNDYDAYNYTTSTADNGTGNGGIKIQISGEQNDGIYRLFVQYHAAGSNPVNTDFVAQEVDISGALNILTTDGSAVYYVNHNAIAGNSLGAYQGDSFSGLVSFIVVPFGTALADMNVSYSTPGQDQENETFTFDLIPPSVTGAVMSCAKVGEPFNASYPHYAKTGDEVKMTFSASESIGGLTGHFNDVYDITTGGTNSATPFAKILMNASMPEGTVTFSFQLYDVNGNAANVTASIPNTTSVIYDKTPPTVATSIVTTDGDYFAKSGDQVTLTLTGSDNNGAIVNGNFDNDASTSEDSLLVFNVGTSTDVTVTPSLSGTASENSTTFQATVTLTDANASTNAYVPFSINKVYDKAKNKTVVSDDDHTGSQVYYDSTLPTVETISFGTPSSGTVNPNPYRVTTGDAIMLSFSTSEVVKYVVGANTDPSVDFQGGGTDGSGGTGNTLPGAIVSTTDLQNYTASLNVSEALTEGVINFSLDFEDRSGNSIASAHTALDDENERITYDHTEPGLNALTIASSSGTGFAKPGQSITISVNPNEDLRYLSDYGISNYNDGIVGTIGGIAADEVRQSDGTWIVTTTLGDAHAEGALAFSLTLKDMAGNTSVFTEADLTAGATIIYDKSAPFIKRWATIQSDNDYTNWATNGDKVTLVFEVNEALIADPNVVFEGAVTGTKESVSEKTYTYSITLANSQGLDEGLLDFTVDFANEANISGTQFNATSDSINTTVTYDVTAPTLTNVYIKSDNSVDSSYAKDGSIATLKFKGVDAQSSGLLRDDVAVTIGGVNATENGTDADANWTATATMTTGVAEGTVAINITFKDLAGNVGTAVTGLSGGRSLTYDETAPTLSGLTMNSSNLNQLLSKPDDVITLTITVNNTVEPNGIQVPTVLIAGKTITNQAFDGLIGFDGGASNGDGSFVAKYKMLNTDAETDSIEFSVNYADLAGNTAAAVATALLGGDKGVSFDKTAPSFTNTESGASVVIVSDNDDTSLGRVSDIVTLTLTSDEALKTGTEPTVTILGNNASVDANDDNTVFTATYTITGNDANEDITNGNPIPISVAATYTDETGNVGSLVSNTTNGSSVTYDIVAPVLDPIRLRSDNSLDSNLAIVGDEVTLTLVSDSPIMIGTKPTIVIAGNTIADGSITRVSNSKFTATYTMQNTSNDNQYDDPDTKLPISITNYKDYAGNVGAAKTATTDPDNSYVTFDNTNPTLTLVTIASNNGTGSNLAIPGNTLTLQFTSDTQIQTPVVTIAGRVPDALTAVGNAHTATLQLTEDDDDASDPIAFTVNYSDMAGNAGVAVNQTGTTDGSFVNFDKTKPQLDKVYIRSMSSSSIDLTGDNPGLDSAYISPDETISLRFRSNEALSSLDIYINGVRGRFPPVDGDGVTVTKIQAYNAGYEKWRATYVITNATDDNGGAGLVVPFTIDFVDENGYDGDQVSVTDDGNTVTFDKTAPTVDVFTYVSNNDINSLAKVNDVITVSLTADELLQDPTITIGSNAVTEAINGTRRSWTATHTMTALDIEGQIEANLVSFTDYAGNSGTGTIVTTDNNYVTFDQTAPTLQIVDVTSSNNYSSNLYAKAGDVITFTINTGNSGELILEPTFTILGATTDITIAPSVDGATSSKIWTAQRTILTDDDEGSVPFSIAFTDRAGNPGVAVTSILSDTDNANVIVDLTATVLNRGDANNVVLDLDSDSDTGVSSTDNLTNVQVPTFNVTGLTGNPVLAGTDSIYIVASGTDTLVRSFVNADDMTFVIPDAKALANQLIPHELTLVTKDRAGNKSGPSDTLKIRVDTSAPALGNAMDMLVSDDTGFLDNDDKTKVRTPKFEITPLEPNKKDELKVYYNTNELLVTHRMNYAVTDTVHVERVLNDGSYTFFYTVTDSAGNTSASSATKTVVIDSTSPGQPTLLDLTDASDSGTSNSDDLTNLSTLSFEIEGLTETDSVYIENSSNVLQGQNIVTNTGKATITLDNVTSNTFSAYAKDLFGNKSLSTNGLAITVDQAATDMTGVAVDLDAGSDSGDSNSDNLTNDVTPTFTVTGLTPTDSLFLLIDGVKQDSVLAIATTHQFTVGRADLTDNIHSATVLSVDYAGNQSLESPALAFTTDATSFTITSLPDLIAASDSGILPDDNITSNREPTFSFTGLSVDTDHISLYVNDENTPIVTGTKLADVTEHSLTVPTISKLSEGDFVFKYKVTDPAGNISDFSGTTSISVDITAPSAPSSAPDLDAVNDSGNSDSDNLTNNTITKIITNGLPVGDTRMLYKVNSLGVTTLIDSQMVGDTGNLSYDDANDASGTFTYHSVLLDVAGNASSNSSSLQVDIDQVAPDLSSAVIDLDQASDTGRSDSDNITNDTTPTFTISGLTVGDSVDLYFNDLTPIRKYANATSISFTATSTEITDDGNYEVSVKATDPAGNISTDVVTLDIVIDTTPEQTLPVPDLLAQDDSGRSAVDDTTSNRAPFFVLGSGIQDQYPSQALTGNDFYIRLYIVDGLDTILVEDNRMTENVFTHTIQIPHEDTNGDFIVTDADYYLSDGPYSVIYTIEDDAGNISDYSTGLDIVIDVTATDVSAVAIDLNDASDAGRANNDDITNVSAPEFTLTNVEETDIVLLNIKDAGGTTIKTLQRTAATESNDTDNIATVSFSAPLDPNDVNWGLTADGTYTITMQSVDQAGNTSLESNALSIIYDATAPNVSSILIDLQSGSDTGILNNDDLTNDTIPVFDITGLNSTNEVYTQEVILNIDWDCTDYDPINPYVFTACTRTTGKTLSSLSTLTVDAMTFTLDGTIIDYSEPSGHYQLSVTSVDIAGNTSVNSTLKAFILDREPETNLPAPDLVSASDKGFYDDDDITNIRDPFMYLGDPTLGNPNAITQEAFQIDLYALTGINNVLVNTETKASGTTDHTMDIPCLAGCVTAADYQLTEGTHFIRYTITDDAGNVSDFSSALEILVDVTPPAAPPVPDLYFLDDLGESDSDDLTSPLNINRPEFPNVDSKLDKSVRLLIDQEGNLSSMLPGYKWTIHNWVDANTDGIIDNGEFTAQDSCLVPGGRFAFFHPINRATNDFNLPSPVGESVTLFDTLSVYDLGQPSNDYFFFSVQTDTAGNRSVYSPVYQVTTDYDAPTCAITYEEGGVASDLLVKSPDASIDAIFTFSKSVDDLSDLPTVDIDYPDLNGTIDPALSAQDLSLAKVGGDDKIWSGVIPFDDTSLDDHDGSIMVNPNIKDVYGNTVTTFTGENDVVIDNTHPQFTNLNPTSGSFNSVLNNFGFMASENLNSGTVTFTNSIGNVEWTADLANNLQNELNTGIPVVDSDFENGPPAITEGIYTITFSGTDPAGNIGETIISDYTYDVTVPTVELSFSQLVASAGTTVQVKGTFSEDMALTPQLLVNTEGPSGDWNNGDGSPNDPAPYDMYLFGECDCSDPVTGDPIDGCDENVSGETMCEDVGNGGIYIHGTDESIWAYDYLVPDGTDRNGNVAFVVAATDKATNAVDSFLDPSSPDSDGQDGVGGTGLTYEDGLQFEIDNTVSVATYTYINTTTPNLVNPDGQVAAKGGDIVKVYVEMNESISQNSPIPSLQIRYGTGNSYESTFVEGFPFTDVDKDIDGNDDGDGDPYNKFTFFVTIADSLLLVDSDGNPGTPMDTIPVDDGYVEFILVGLDRAFNSIQQHENNLTLFVDNIHPAIFQTGNINGYGDNPVEGWLSGITDSVGVEVDIPTSDEDFSLNFNGTIRFQVKNLTRGLFWRDISLDLVDGQNPQGPAAGTITTTGDAIEYYRRYDEIIAALDADQGIQTGDQVSIRAVMTDGYGNVREGIPTHLMTNDNGVYTPAILTYDIDAPLVGEIVYGENTNFGTTINSYDSVKVEWTSFVEQDVETESGLEYYELKIERFDMAQDTDNGGVADGLLLDWFRIDNISDLKYAEPFLLEHNHGYIASIRAYDFAGNISNVVATNQLLRLNTPPEFEEHGNENLDEDIYWTTTIKFTDVDFNVLQHDTVTIFAEVYPVDDFSDIPIDTNVVDPATLSSPIAFDAVPYALTNEIGEPLDCDGNPLDLTLEENPCYATTLVWTPLQSDAGSYELRITGTDYYLLESTSSIPMLVRAVNDTPRVSIAAGTELTWEEDEQRQDFLEFQIPVEDVDDALVDLDWIAVIMDTSQLDEDYPFGHVVSGPDTPPAMKAEISRKYLGFNPNMSAQSMLGGLSAEKIQLMQQTRNNPLITVVFDTLFLPDNSDTTIVARFQSAENYYGSNHRVKFYVQDPSGASNDNGIENTESIYYNENTLIVNIIAENDSPVIDSESMDSIVYIVENDSIMLEFGQYVTDVDDTSLTFSLSVVADELNTSDDKITIIPLVEGWTMDPDNIDNVSFVSYGLGDTVMFVPQKLWSDSATIKLEVSDGQTTAEEVFLIDVKHVDRPKLSVSVLQQTAFSKYMQVILVDTAMKALNMEMKVQNVSVPLNELASYTYTGHMDFILPGEYSIDIAATAEVGDTSFSRSFNIAAGRVAEPWSGSSNDGLFSISGSPGAILFDQPFLIADSTLFPNDFYDRGSYIFGSEDYEFNRAIEIRLKSDRSDLAIYRRTNNFNWVELPSLNSSGDIFTLSYESGYFRLGPKTIIVPEQTNIQQNYPNPFNPSTTIVYDIGLLDGLRQNVSINVYNLLGQHVAALVENRDQIGQFKIQWDGHDKFGQEMSSGIYFVQLTTKTGIVKNKKMMLMK